MAERWPGEYCPTHLMEAADCTKWCLPARVEGARAARALEDYWPTWRERMVLKYGRWFFDTPQGEVHRLAS